MEGNNNKKKKNKKKKGNNQNKTADNVPAVTVEGIGAWMRQDDGSASQQEEVSASADVQSVGVSESDAELEKHKTNEENNASLEEKLRDLQKRTDSFLLKEATLEDRVKYIEGLQDSWTLQENLIIESIARLDEVNIGLQDQVKELQESQANLVEENIQLKQSITVMESRIHHLETEASLSRSSAVKIIELPEKKDPEHQLEAAHIPEEQARVNDAQYVIDQPNVVAEHSTTDHTTSPLSASPVDYDASEYNVEMFESGQMVQTLARAQKTYDIPNRVEEDLGTHDGSQGGRLLGIDNSRISEDVVSVPLDDIQVLETEPLVVKNEDNNPVLPLSDAPLIGAPFRLFSAVAKYVSGADLASKEKPRYG